MEFPINFCGKDRNSDISFCDTDKSSGTNYSLDAREMELSNYKLKYEIFLPFKFSYYSAQIVLFRLAYLSSNIVMVDPQWTL